MMGFVYNVHTFLSVNQDLLEQPIDKMFEAIGCGMVKVKTDFEFRKIHIKKGFYLGFEHSLCVFIIADTFIVSYPSIDEFDEFREKADIAVDMYIPLRGDGVDYRRTSLISLIHKYKGAFIDDTGRKYFDYWYKKLGEAYPYLISKKDE